ncbi:T-cell leukemia/lymphoma protein 1A [Sigmodon hispidus]
MAEEQGQRLETPEAPERLWLWEKHVYLDEHRRSWLPIVLKSNAKLQVILRQEDVPLGTAMVPRHLEAYELPLMWQLYPGKKYRSHDSVMWQIVYHIKSAQLSQLVLSSTASPGKWHQRRAWFLPSPPSGAQW